MEWLRDGYAPALALLERVTGFLDWLEADGGNMQKVAEWWLRLVGRVSVRA